MHTRVMSAAVAASVALSLVPGAARSETSAVSAPAASVVAMHAAYVGHPEGVVTTYRYFPPEKAPAPRSTPAPDEPKIEPTQLTTYRRGALYRDVYRGSGVTSQAGFTGRAFWTANENGYTAVAYELSARRRLTTNLVDSDQLADVPATARGAQSVGGVAVEVVRFTPPQGIPVDVAFDRATGAYVEVTFDPDKKYATRSQVVHVDGYTEAAPGVRVPSGYHSGEYGGWKLTEKAVRAVTNEDLRGPTPTATWDFQSMDTTPIEIVAHQTQYSFLPTGHAAHVHATIDGHVGTFLLDSGASSILLYRPFSDKVKVTKLGRTAFSGVNGGMMGARLARVDAIQVGKNTLKNVIVTLAGGEFAEGIDGILGYDFLAGALVDVDTADQTIRILDPSKMEPVVKPGAYAFTVNLASGQPEVNLKASGVPTSAIFDTGADYLAVLSDDLQSSGRIVALTDQIKLGGGQTIDYRIGFFGVDGPANAPARCSRLSQIEVGPYKYQNVETCFASANVFGRDGGLIGFDFLKHFNWTFDYVESKLVLTPNGK